MRPRMINAPHQVGRQMQGSFAVIAFVFRLTGHASSGLASRNTVVAVRASHWPRFGPKLVGGTAMSSNCLYQLVPDGKFSTLKR
jgi:hypothetical protein